MMNNFSQDPLANDGKYFKTKVELKINLILKYFNLYTQRIIE
jgi:hypothetical protein